MSCPALPLFCFVCVVSCPNVLSSQSRLVLVLFYLPLSVLFSSRICFRPACLRSAYVPSASCLHLHSAYLSLIQYQLRLHFLSVKCSCPRPRSASVSLLSVLCSIPVLYYVAYRLCLVLVSLVFSSSYIRFVLVPYLSSFSLSPFPPRPVQHQFFLHPAFVLFLFHLRPSRLRPLSISSPFHSCLTPVSAPACLSFILVSVSSPPSLYLRLFSVPSRRVFCSISCLSRLCLVATLSCFIIFSFCFRPASVLSPSWIYPRPVCLRIALVVRFSLCPVQYQFHFHSVSVPCQFCLRLVSIPSQSHLHPFSVPTPVLSSPPPSISASRFSRRSVFVWFFSSSSLCSISVPFVIVLSPSRFFVFFIFVCFHFVFVPHISRLVFI